VTLRESELAKVSDHKWGTMKELVEYIAKSIVSHPDHVEVLEEDVGAGDIRLSLTVHPDDMGKAIGSRGRIVQSIRTVLRVSAVKHDVRVSLEID